MVVIEIIRYSHDEFPFVFGIFPTLDIYLFKLIVAKVGDKIRAARYKSSGKFQKLRISEQ